MNHNWDLYLYLLDLGKHTKLVWLRLPNSHCATKSLVTALQMSDVHFKSQTSTVQCFRFTEIVCTLLFSFYLWRQVEIKISKMIWLRQAARASKTSFLSAEKRALFTPITHCFRFAIVKLKWTFSVQWIRKLLISETVIVCCSAKKWLTLNISNCIRPPLQLTFPDYHLHSLVAKRVKKTFMNNSQVLGW